MSYQVIARKWRPQTFEEVTGQEAVTRTLRNAVQFERLHHAYLFSGARGVGKTTTARLLAKALNCHKTEKPNPKPCSPSDPEACPSCKEIAEGRSIDVLEIDAASNTGIDDVRDRIIENINSNAARDRYKVFIIDEVHQLSKAAFNALLKTLEEPPPKVMFIMATTELHKVPDTILSRCQEFEFKTIALTKIFDSLKNIAAVEKVNITDAALKEVARAGEGSMRDAQSAFDQVISFSGEKIEVEDVVNALGIAGVDILLRTVKGIAEHNMLEAFEVVENLTDRGHDLRSFCRDLLSFFRDLMVAKVAPNAEGLLDWAAVSHDELKKQAAEFSEADLLRFFNSLADTEAQIRTATQPRYILEIGLVKLMEMRRVAPIEKLLERLAALENGDTVISSKPGSPPAEAAKTSASSQAPSAGSAAPAEKKTEFLDVLFERSEEEEQKIEEPVKEPAEKASPGVKAEPPAPAIPAAQPVYSQPQSSYVSTSSATSAAALAPHLISEDFAHIEDTWLDHAYERALLRAGDDFSIVLTLDFSGLVQQQPKYVPPPAASVMTPAASPATVPIAAPVITRPATLGQNSPPGKSQNGVAPGTGQVKSAPVGSLLSKFKIALKQKGKTWLAKAFDEISRIESGDGELVLLLPEKAEYWKSILQEPENIETIREIAKNTLQKDMSPVVKIEGQDVRLDLPTRAQLEKSLEENPELWEKARGDAAVKQIINVFRGQIIDVRHTSSE
jgi:DNA polymerase-3 subunit gamma/tau